MKKLLDILITAIIIIFLLKILPVITTYLPVITTYLYEGFVGAWDLLPSLAAKSKFLNYMGDIMFLLGWLLLIWSIIYIPVIIIERILKARCEDGARSRSRTEKSFLGYIFQTVARLCGASLVLSIAQVLGSHFI